MPTDKLSVRKVVMRMLLYVVAVLVGLLVILVGVVLVRTLTFRSVQVDATENQVKVDAGGVAARLAQALQFQTISKPEMFDPATFETFFEWLAATYPQSHAAMRIQVVAGHSRLLTWEGSDPDLKPVLFMAHADVAPVEAGTEEDWAHPPFSGVIAPCSDEGGEAATDSGDCVWGRGALDMKSVLTALMEGAESLAAESWQPRRTLMFAFGHDEEVGGSGNQTIADMLKDRGVQFEWVLDEGLVITDGIMPGATAPIAPIGIAEKGFLSLELTAGSQGGHSSMPPPHTAVGVLARAIARLEENPFPAGLHGPFAAAFGALGPEMPFGQRLAFANLWLLGSVVKGQLAASNATNAGLRTTQAATMFEGGMQDNVLPQSARAVVNFRIHPRDSIASVTERVKETIDDPNVEVRALKDSARAEPSPVADPAGPGFKVVERAIRGVCPTAIVAPSLSVVATDSRHYAGLADNVYRFEPYWMRARDTSRPHGTNELIFVDNYAQFVRFYHQVIRDAGQP